MDSNINSVEFKFIENLSKRLNEEQYAIGSKYGVLLNRLGISLKEMSQRNRNTLKRLIQCQSACGLTKLDPITVSIWYTDEMLQTIENDEEKLKTENKIKQLDLKIKQNNKYITDFKADYQDATKRLHTHEPNLDTVLNDINILQHKILSYEQNFNMTKNKLARLGVQQEVYPVCLQSLIDRLKTLEEEEKDLGYQAEGIKLARTAKRNLLKLKGGLF